VACLRATDRPVYAINPRAVARYRERHAVSGKKSDHADAVALAGILRTDMAAHRPLPADLRAGPHDRGAGPCPAGRGVDRTQAHNKPRSLLREYYPGFLAAFRDTRGGILRGRAGDRPTRPGAAARAGDRRRQRR
jgi:hypothetical protein